MSAKEAKARVKINKLLEEAGWRFEDGPKGKANIQLEAGVKFTDLGNDFEEVRGGSIDFLLLDKDDKPLVVVEAKKESIDPLSAKEQAREYAQSSKARFIILSNGNIHYLWDTKHGNPETISRFPTQESVTQYESYIPNPKELAETNFDENYIIESQMPNFLLDPSFQNESTRKKFLKDNRLKQLRPYQVNALKGLQKSVEKGNQRFLFEMATGTGKTLVSAAVIKLFLKTGNAKRVLFLVDRLELEDQASRAFINYLGKDFNSVVFKEKRDSWRSASIVVTTIQSLMAGDKYRKEFSPTDFELVISDEAHRSVGGSSRAVFEYFVGYKLGLTATPKDYLKGLEDNNIDSQREYERRVLLSTYETFGCKNSEPTYRYDLLAGVKEGFLINPIVVDARTEVTTKLLSDEGLSVHRNTEEQETEEVFTERHYEKKLFNEETNVAMCKAFLDNGFLDPVAEKYGISLFGKSIVFCVSQKHAAKVTNILNKLALEKWPSVYNQSDFAMQVTSHVKNAQLMTIQFANNRLGGKAQDPEGYDSCKARVCVTVGMMTTGYDCEDLLNIALMKPVFSPSDFVQIKGRGTRKFAFEYEDYKNKEKQSFDKERFKFFDFFATCEYFENDFKYDDKIKLPQIKKEIIYDGTEEFIDEHGNKVLSDKIDLAISDSISTLQENPIDHDGMRIDREGFRRAIQEDIVGNKVLKGIWDNGDIEEAEDYCKKNVFDKPKYFLNLDKIRKIFDLDRRISIKEFLQFAFGEKEVFEMKEDLLELEWIKFQEVYPVDQDHYEAVHNFFKAYIVDEEVRDIVERNQPAELNHCASFDFEEYKRLNGFREIIPIYIKDYIKLNTFLS